MEISKSLIVIRYQFMMATRQIFRFKSHTVYSLAVLAIGLACVFIISAWTMQELRFDRFHRQPGQIYMVTTDIKDNTGNVRAFPETPQPLAAELAMQIPLIDKAFHFLYLYGGRSIGTGEHSFKEFGVAANPDFLEVLNFKLLSGNAGALSDLNSILLSRNLAEKLFPGIDPINQELIYKEDQIFVVKGVFKNIPMNSSLQFDFLIPYDAEYGITTEWNQLSDATFIKLLPTADPHQVDSMMRQIWRENVPSEHFDIGMISIADLRYGADFEFFNAEHGHGDRIKLYMFMGIAVLILLLACLNYLILTSANMVNREKEMWIRKIHGASRGAISSYFIFESVLFSMLAWGAAAILATLGLRLFEDLLGIVISPAYFNASIGLGMVVSLLLVGLASGFYPAVQVASGILVRKHGVGRTGMVFQRNLRQIFVGSQFILSIALTISGLVIFRQANYMKNFDSGYATGNCVEFSFSPQSDTIAGAIRDWLDGQPAVQGFSFAGSSPVHLTILNTIQDVEWEGLEEEAHISVFQIVTDQEYLRVFDIPVIKGRFFSPLDEHANRIVINGKFATLMGMDDPVGQVISRGNTQYEIIGVVKDFNFQHLSNEVGPLLFFFNRSGRRLFVNFNSNANAASAIETIQKKLSDISGRPVNKSFIREKRDQLYTGESQMLAATLFFSVLSILLSSLGLVGLVSHSATEKTKEIAVRKVFGADYIRIMQHQLWTMLKMFLPAVFLGGALAWFIMTKWLENYAYRSGIEGWVFVLGPGMIFVFALISIGFQIWKASRQVPAISLKHQ